MAAPNVNLVGSGSTVTWGVSEAGGNPAGGVGVWISASLAKSGEVIPINTTQGVPDGLVIVPGLIEGDYELYSAANLPGPNLGETVNVASQSNFYVKTVTFRWQQKGIKMQSVQASGLPS